MQPVRELVGADVAPLREDHAGAVVVLADVVDVVDLGHDPAGGDGQGQAEAGQDQVAQHVDLGRREPTVSLVAQEGGAVSSHTSCELYVGGVAQHRRQT